MTVLGIGMSTSDSVRDWTEIGFPKAIPEYVRVAREALETSHRSSLEIIGMQPDDNADETTIASWHTAIETAYEVEKRALETYHGAYLRWELELCRVKGIHMINVTGKEERYSERITNGGSSVSVRRESG